jgi:hypothetical protein
MLSPSVADGVSAAVDGAVVETTGGAGVPPFCAAVAIADPPTASDASAAIVTPSFMNLERMVNLLDVVFGLRRSRYERVVRWM